MDTLMDAYEKKYGSAEKGYLYRLNGDPSALAKEIEALPSDHLPFGLSLGANDPEDDLHFAILREIQRLYFRAISREHAVGVCCVLADLGELRPFPGLPDFCFNSITFMHAWNEANNDQPPIQVNGVAWFSV